MGSVISQMADGLPDDRAGLDTVGLSKVMAAPAAIGGVPGLVASLPRRPLCV